jgi:(2R)-ethylmalonyl-CoA mutase
MAAQTDVEPERGGAPAVVRGDPPWLFRTYAGHSSAAASNVLYRTNLARGQTGLSVAFDLPTQTGYDSDHPLAAGEIGRVGVPICSLSDMTALFDGIPLERTNTSMTINATAPWLLALYVVVAEQQGADPARLAGTVQNDLFKEYLARGTYIFPPRPSLKLTEDLIAFTAREMPKWNPINVCSYHLQEAGATPVQELAYALATAIAVLDQVRVGGQVPVEKFPHVVGRISFFVNAGVRFVTEMCKLRAFVELWDQITAERYGVADPKLRRFRYGVQVNSLGLTEQQPENNVYRILLEALAVVLSKRARARAVQLPAWNEALGLPRPWDQQWSLRLQQILAYETDLLEYDDLFDGAPVIAAQVEAMVGEARAELAKIETMGWRARRGRERLHQAAPGGIERAAACGDRGRDAARGRGQLLHRDGGVAAYRGSRRLSRDRPRRRSRADRAPQCPSRIARRRRGGRCARGTAAGSERGREHHAAVDRVRPRRRHDR